MLSYESLKLVHQTTVVLSITGFALRGGLMLADSDVLRLRWMRTWPHLIDTLLLVSGVWMASRLALSPLEQPWLAAKIVALLAYIGFGFIALRLGKTRGRRIAALIAALLCFAYIALTAINKSPWPF